MIKVFRYAIFLVLLNTINQYAQPLALYDFTQETGSYNEIASGTVLPAIDDEGFADIPIGFDFGYAGNLYSRFGVNTNGYIILGSDVPVEYIYAQYNYNNVILPLHIDLISDITGGQSELKYLLEGSPPNRVLTIQWKNWDPKLSYYEDSTFAVNFQVKLFETTNKIEFRYGFFQNNPPKFFQYYQPVVGLKGGSISEFRLREYDFNVYGWINSIEGSTIYSSMFVYDTIVPPAGLVYTFFPPGPVPMSYISSTVTQHNTTPVYLGDLNKEIVRIEINTEGNISPFALTQLNLNTFGSSNPATDISSAKVFYTAGDSSFNSSQQFGSTSVNPIGSFSVSGSQQLAFGKNYFWLCYDINSTASAGNVVDGQCTQLVLSGAGGSRIPLVLSPPGIRTILCREFIGLNQNSLQWPFGTSVQGRKTQILYTAEEIRATCVNCNIFGGIGFNFTGNAVKTLQNFQVRMKNTSLSSLNANFVQDSFKTVFSGTYTTSGPGWQFINLQNDFVWDGQRNIIVEICFQNSAVLPSPVPEVAGSSTTGNHTTLSAGSVTACGLNSGSAFNVKPDIKFVTSSTVTVTSQAVQSNTAQVLSGSVNNEVLKIPVVLKRCGIAPVNLTSLSFNTNGSTNPAGDISSAKVFYTGSSNIFSTGTQFGSAVNDPNGNFSFTGNIPLPNDTGYFWLSYDIRSTATHLNNVDAEFTSFTAGGNVVIPSITAPAGSRTINALGAMSGIYYIGSGMDFLTITQAVNSLNVRGISSTVTFLLTDTAYSSETYPIVIRNDVAGLAGGNYFIIKPAPGINVNITGLPPAGDNSIFKILGNNVIIDGSNLTGGSTRNLFINNIQRDLTNDGPRAVNIQSEGSIPVNNISIKNCRLRVKAYYDMNNGYGEVVKIGYRNSNAAYREFNGINIHNNEISGGVFGVYANANSAAGLHSLNLTVTDNNLDVNDTNRIRVSGVFAKGFDNSVVTGNSIGNFYSRSELHYHPDNNSCGIHINGDNTIIEKNRIFNIKIYWGYVEGIRTSGSNVKIANNFITDILSHLFETVGIFSYCYGKQLIVNNSVNIFGEPAADQSGSDERCLLLTRRVINTDTIFVKNNIFSVNIPNPERDCYLIEMYDSLNSPKNLISNNCYYFDAVHRPRFLFVSTSGGFALDSVFESWQSRTGLDKNSFCLNPGFISGSDLHINPAVLSVNGRGSYINGISDDIDGQSRPQGQSTTESPVDVGADQYTPLSFTGNNAILTGNVYKDGLYPVISKTSGSFTTVSAKVYPGVRSNFGSMSRFSGKSRDNLNSLDADHKYDRSSFIKVLHGSTDHFNSQTTPWIFWEFIGFTPVVEPIVLKFYYNEEQLATISELNLRIAVFNGATWDSTFAQNVNTDSNYIEVTFPDGYGWSSNPVFSLIYNENALPVLISGFTANILMRDVQLRWVTETEINNRGFYAERRMKLSDNSYTNWQQLGFIEGSGTTAFPVEYSYIDRKLGKGTYQYRLKQVDLNGNYEYHFQPVEQVIGNPAKFELGQNYPNPSNPVSKIDFTLPFKGKVSLKVYDLLGREVETLIDKELQADYYTAEFDGSNLGSGVYFYRLLVSGAEGNVSKTMKMMIIK